MIFRTGGEKRLSNFLPFQSAYSELIFTDKRWPELTKRGFNAALKEFENRQRRFGAQFFLKNFVINNELLLNSIGDSITSAKPAIP